MRRVKSAECGICRAWELRSVEMQSVINEVQECGRYIVRKIRSVEKRSEGRK